MAGVTMRDMSPAGHVLGGASVEELPARMTAGELLAERVRREITTYDQDPGDVLQCLVQPDDSIRRSDGLHMLRPRPLEPEHYAAAAVEALDAGLLALDLGDRVVTSSGETLDLDVVDRIDVVLRRSVVVADPD